MRYSMCQRRIVEIILQTLTICYTNFEMAYTLLDNLHTLLLCAMHILKLQMCPMALLK
jgi:hypothetical protein